ncbi:MAG TPA: CoA transferase [Burkholderiaceae bacterium]|nr:CoA transferase [Burkholderiaceae bacterium]
MAPKVLDGVRVLEHGTFITGPAASMLLADLGADVIKVEQREGDPFRAFRGGLYSPHYQTYNRNKRSVTLDTREAAGLERFDALVREADVYIQNFRPGVADKIGAGEARLRALNPRLVYCAISGFGPDGPAAQRPSYDTVAQAASGFLKLLVNPANPRVVGPAIADALTGFYAAYGILGALYERARRGGAPGEREPARGRKVEVSMLEAMTHFNLDAFTHLFSEGEVMGPFSRPSVSQSYVLPCADGKWIALHMSSPPKFWAGLAQAIERPALFDDPRFATREARIANQAALIDLLGDIFRARERAEWCRRLEALDVPHAPMYDTNEVPEDPQARHLQLFVETAHPEGGTWKTVRSPVSFDGQRALDVRAPPLLGQHNDALGSPGWPARDGRVTGGSSG